MLKIKKQAQSIYAFKETGGEILRFQIEKDNLILFSDEQTLYEIKDKIITSPDFGIRKIVLFDEKVCILCNDETNVYLLVACMSNRKFKYNLGEGALDFLIIKDDAYIIYSEEGIFGSEGNIPLAKLGFIRIDIFTGEITGLLDDDILMTLVDVQSISCNNKSIKLLCYGEDGTVFTIDYDLTSKKIYNKVVLNYDVSILASMGENYYVLIKHCIYLVDKNMGFIKKQILDKKIYDESFAICSGYNEIVLENENEYNVVRISKL